MNIIETQNDVAALFPGFASKWVQTTGGRLHARVGGPPDGEPLLLLHGFPQSSASWHTAATVLSERYRVVCLDLKGYGQSDAQHGDGGRLIYAKRTLAQEACR